MHRLNLTLILLLTLASCATSPKPAEKIHPATPEQELAALVAGNQRFTSHHRIDQDYYAEIAQTKDVQKPDAVILGCIDSRVPPEIIFDQGIGDLFVARVAGNIEDRDILASIEFSTKIMGSKLVVVLGHTHCGAIKGACQNVKLEDLTALLAKIKPSISAVEKRGKKIDPTSYEDIDLVSEENVRHTLAAIHHDSKVIRDLEAAHQIKLVGAIYDVSTGAVRFLN